MAKTLRMVDFASKLTTKSLVNVDHAGFCSFFQIFVSSCFGSLFVVVIVVFDTDGRSSSSKNSTTSSCTVVKAEFFSLHKI